MVKTVLAPDAPWPNKPVEKPKVVKAAPKPHNPPPPKSPSKIAHTSKKFDEWAKKNGVKK